jgi:polyvinyl alcohol dehydrogenase (cytochrome)
MINITIEWYLAVKKYQYWIGIISCGLVIALTSACVPDPDEEEQAQQSAVFSSATPEQLYMIKCGICHSNPDTKSEIQAPSLSSLQKKSMSSVVFALFNGIMRTQAQDLTPEQKIEIADFITGGKPPYQPATSQYCQDRNIDLTRVYAGNRGLNTNNSAAVGKDISKINSHNVSTLKLKWVFELPDTSDARSQPVITEDTLIVAAADGDVFALDRQSACIKWHYHSEVPIRTTLTLHTLKVDNSTFGLQSLVYFGDANNFVNALDPLTGKLTWRTNVEVSPNSMLTGAVSASENFLIVPVSLIEVVLAADSKYECCKAHGAVHRLNAVTGEIEWTTHMTDEATPRKKSRIGTQLWGPSGAPVWSTPTVDSQRRKVYIGTGQNASLPATDTSDAIIALHLDSGRIAWQFQAMAGDTYNGGCSSFPKGYNCPKRQGPDFDFGASVVIARNSQGRDILLAGQKSGDIFALDPDGNGKVIWRTRIGSGSFLGGVHWGMAIADGKLFAASNDPPFPNYSGHPGLYVLNIDNGEELWKYEVSRGCETTMAEYFQRQSLYPECSYYYAFSAAVSVANDVVFAPALDGKVRAFDSNTGSLLWQYNTAREFSTVAGSLAHGGSMDNVSVQFARNMVYMQSGYSLFGQLPGNILLAFEIGQ